MAKIRKAVFRSGIVMMSLLAAIVLSSSVAQAQECVAFQSNPTTARAEGLAEMMGGIHLLCRTPQGFGLPPVPGDIELTITLNTEITNGTTMDDVVEGLMYDGALLPDRQWPQGDDKEVLSDGNTITWELAYPATGTRDLNLGS